MSNSTCKSWQYSTIVVAGLFFASPCALAQTPEKESPPPATKAKTAPAPKKPKAKTTSPTKSEPKKTPPAKIDPKKAKTTKGSSKKAAKKPIPPKKVAAKPLTKEEKEIVENLELLLLLELLNDYDLFDEEPK